MAPKGSSRGKGKARAKMPTSGINRHLSLDRDNMKGFISEHLRGLIRISNVCGIKDERAQDLFYAIIFLDPATTHHISQFQLMCPHCRSRSSPLREWCAAIHSYMGQIFDKTRDQMSNWSWDNPRAFGDQVDRSNPPTTSSGKVERTGERFSWYGSDDFRAKIEAPNCRQYQPGDFLAVRPLNWDEIIEYDDDDDNWADPGAPSSGSSRPGDGNENNQGEGEDDTLGAEKGTRKEKGMKDGKGNPKWNGKGNGKGKGIVKRTPGGDDTSCDLALELQKQMSEADLDKEG
jgi:hypothetical protein